MAKRLRLLAHLLLTSILLLEYRHLVSAEEPGCKEGEFLISGVEHHCVSECPCGLFADKNRICSNEADDRVFFNLRSQTFTVPISAKSHSHIGTMWLSVRNDSFDGDSLSLSFRFQTLSAYYLENSQVFFASVKITFEIGGQPFHLYDQDFVSLNKVMIAECSGKSADYIQIPVEVYFLDDVNFPGTIEHYLTINIGVGTFYQTTIFADLSIIMKSVCQENEVYVASTSQCAPKCPCGTKTVSFYCDERIPGLGIDPAFQVVDADATTHGNSTVMMFNLYLNVTPGAEIATLSYPWMYLGAIPYAVIHSDVDYGDFYSHIASYYPSFDLKMDGERPANPLFVNGSSSIKALFPTSSLGVDECIWRNSTFLHVRMELDLVSPFYYHLGQYKMDVYASASSDSWYHDFSAESILLINVNTNEECGLAEHYSFDSGSCVEECPCGFIGFDYHNPHYCEPTVQDPFFFYTNIYFLFFPFVIPARFSETAYKVVLPWDKPIPKVSFESKIYVDLQYSYNIETLAHIKVVYTGSDYANVTGYGADIPDIVLTGPVIADSSRIVVNQTDGEIVLILKNSSQYGVQYCTNDLQDEAYIYIPITITVLSPEQYTHIAKHSYVLYMTFEATEADSSTLFFPYFDDQADLTIVVEEGDIGQTPRPVTLDPLVEGIDFYPFVDLLDYDYQEMQPTLDGSSEAISISVGLPFGNSIQTQVYVGVNGIISFERQWPFSDPSLFPTSSYSTRGAYVVAPFWADHDLRHAGAVRYVIIEVAEGGGRNELLANVSAFVRERNEDARQSRFEGVWMMVAHWDRIHPYPHGSPDSYYQNHYKDFIEKQNSYQAFVITDGADSYALFAYNCDQLQWTGYWQYGVVGYNAKGDYYDNHPASGFEFVGTAVACANNLYGSPWNNVVYKISLTAEFRLSSRRECLQRVIVDQDRIPDPVAAAGSLEPCPCSFDQARRDWGRFTQLPDKDLCFVQNFPVVTEVTEGSASFTQECCYAPQGTEGGGSLITSGQYAGSMLSYHPLMDYDEFVAYDQLLRDYCCGVADMCSRYFTQRPIDNCNGYEPPTLTWGIGDPHITTLDGRSYTFNGWGEYILMEYAPEGRTSAEFVVQGRMTSVNESNPKSATQFSAFAFGIPGKAVFQVGQKEGTMYVYSTSRGFAEDISSYLLNVSNTYNETGKAVLTRRAENSILAVFSNSVGVVVNVTAGIPNFVVALPTSFKGQTHGLLGNYNDNETDEFVPRNGVRPLSDAVSDAEIHTLFGQTWAVSSNESLFAYSLEGKSFQNYQFPDHIPVFADQITVTTEQKEACGQNLHCLYDYSQTGNVEIGLAASKLDKTNTLDQTLLANFPPNMSGNSVFRVTVGQQSEYAFTVTDNDPEDAISVGVVGGLPNLSNLIDQGKGAYVFQWTLQSLTNTTLTLVAKDSMNTSATLSPRLEVCACANGGECTNEGLLETDAPTIIMNCNCTSAYDGPFCEEDRDGCADIDCYEGVGCLDVPAPGEGAQCGPCPLGFTGDGSKCLDLDECAFVSSVCDQICINTKGSYDCLCYQGYKMSPEGDCEDVNECSEVNDCQQECINTPGSYLCSCVEGFELTDDNKSCDALHPCLESSCSHACALVDGVAKCVCHAGYKLEPGSSENCIDVNECLLYSPCAQQCTNLPGSFECWCKQGYMLDSDGVTCTDVDECLEGALYSVELCLNNSVCVNNEGSYDCVCSPGYSLANGSCQRDEEVSPSIVQITPVDAVNNRMRVVMDGLTLVQFVPERRQEFKSATAQLVTEYCSSAVDCLTASKRKRRQLVVVEAQNVALQNVGEDSEGRVTFFMYIQLEEGILVQEVVQNALQGNEQLFIDGIAGATAISFDVVVIPSTSVILAPTTSATSVISLSPSLLSSQELPVTSSMLAAVVTTSSSVDLILSKPSSTQSVFIKTSLNIVESVNKNSFTSTSVDSIDVLATPSASVPSASKGLPSVPKASSPAMSSTPSMLSSILQLASSQTHPTVQSSYVVPENTSLSLAAILVVAVVLFLVIVIIVTLVCISCVVVLQRKLKKKAVLLLDDSSVASFSPMYIPSNETEEPFPDKKDTHI